MLDDALFRWLSEPTQLSWGTLFGIEGLIGVSLIGILVMLVVRRPEFLWPLLVGINVVANGPKVHGYFILDELLTLAVTLGAGIALVRSDRGREWRRPTVDEALFALWLLYLLGAAIVGAIQNEDLKLVRWVVLFGTLLVLSRVTQAGARIFKRQSNLDLALLIVCAALAYFAAYLAVGVASDFVLAPIMPFGRFVSQGAIWAGSAAAVFPAIVALPAGIVLIGSTRKWSRVAALALFIMCGVIGAYFFSRTLSLVLTAMIFAALPAIGPRARAGLIGTALLAVLAALAAGQTERLESAVVEAQSAASLLVAPDESDAQSRGLQLEAGLATALQSPTAFILGAGYYSHRFEMAPVVQRLNRERFPEHDDFATYEVRRRGEPAEPLIRTIGLSALLVDTGLVGVVLLISAVGLAIVRVWRSRSRFRIPLVLCLLLVPLWLVASNILDTILLYLIIMPGGIADQLSEESVAVELPPARLPALVAA